MTDVIILLKVIIEVFKMFSGYTEIDIKVLFTLDGNDKGLRGHSKKICKTYQITYQTRPPQGKLAQPQESHRLK